MLFSSTVRNSLHTAAASGCNKFGTSLDSDSFVSLYATIDLKVAGRLAKRETRSCSCTARRSSRGRSRLPNWRLA